MTAPALSPEVVAGIDDLDLVARLVVEGTRTGGHRSPFHGFTTEFRQHRPYRAGDDLRRLDWKLFARSDRLYTRQYRETTNLPVMLVLDASASMAYPRDGVSKFRYGVILLAALAHLAAEQGHAVGLMSMAGERLAHIPARGGRQHLRILLARLAALTPDAAWDAPRVIDRSAHLLGRRGLIVLATDGYDAEAESARAIRRVAGSGHDVALLQILSPAERTLPLEGQIEWRDLETGARRVADAGQVRAAYGEAMAAFLDRSRRDAVRAGVDHTLCLTDMPPAAVLRDFLRRRAAPTGDRPR